MEVEWVTRGEGCNGEGGGVCQQGLANATKSCS